MQALAIYLDQTRLERNRLLAALIALEKVCAYKPTHPQLKHARQQALAAIAQSKPIC